MSEYTEALKKAKEAAPDASAEATIQALLDDAGVGGAHTNSGDNGPPPKKPGGNN